MILTGTWNSDLSSSLSDYEVKVYNTFLNMIKPKVMRPIAPDLWAEVNLVF